FWANRYFEKLCGFLTTAGPCEARPGENKTARQAGRFCCFLVVDFRIRTETKPIRTARSARIVHVEIDRVRRHFETLHLSHLEIDIAVDEIIVEHAAVLEECAPLVEVL